MLFWIDLSPCSGSTLPIWAIWRAIPGSSATKALFSPAMARPLMKVWGVPGPNESATMAKAWKKSAFSRYTELKKSSRLTSSAPHVWSSQWPRVIRGQLSLMTDMTTGMPRTMLSGSRTNSTADAAASMAMDPTLGVRRWSGHSCPGTSAGLAASGIHMRPSCHRSVSGCTHSTGYVARAGSSGCRVRVSRLSSVVRITVSARLSWFT